MQTLAPIHLLPPRPDGSLDHWRGAYWGMNNPAAYTPLESLFLFQAILKHGVEAAAFTKVSDLLVNNALIKDDKTYDARRLSPDALRQLFLHLLQEELRSENATADKPDGTLSPNSKKRKLNRPPLPTLKEVKEQLHKLPALVDRLYARYKDHVVKGVREDERRIEILAREVQVLEAHEAADRAKANAPRQVGPNGTSGPKTIPTPVPIPSPIPTPAQAAAHPQVKPPTPTPPAEAPRPIRPASGQASAPTQTPVPIPTPVPLPPQAHARPPANAAPVPPTAPQPTPARRDVAPPTGAFQPPPVAPPAQAAMAAGAPATTSSTAPAVKQHPPPKLPNSAGQVLQPPNSAGHPPVRPGQSTSPVPLPAISPRPDNIPKSRTPGPATPAQPSTPGTLKWEKPYQPAAPAPQPQGRTMPPHIPTTSAPSTPGQPNHPSQWYPQPTGQYHGPPQPPHVPIQPNPAQRYPQQPQSVLVPPQPQTQAHPQGQGQGQPQAQPKAQTPAQGPARSQSQSHAQPPHQPQPPQAQPKGQLVAPVQSTPVKGPPERSAIQPPQGRPSSTTPIAPPVRPQPTQQQQQQQQQQQKAHSPAPHTSQPPHPSQPPTGYQHQPRPLAAASPTPSSGPPGQTAVPPPRWPQSYPSPYAQQQFSPSPAPAQLHAKAADTQRRVSSPFNKQQQHPRPAIPPHLVPQLAATPQPAQRAASTPVPPPQTPVTAPPTFLLTGSGTKWTLKSTPSTPRPSGAAKDVASPAFEPLSPVQQLASLPAPTPSQVPKKASPKPTPVPVPVPKTESRTPGPRGRGRPPRSANKVRADSTPSSVVGMRRSQSVASQTDELSMDHHELAPRIKDENATPRATPRATPKPQDETGDTTADESVPSRRNMITPSSVSSRLAHKRKRQDTPTEPLPLPTAPTHVLWTRQFGRVSAAALDQISAHRFANQFANPIRERDAPGYKTLILQPQDIKSIRAAITHGNRAATEAAKALPDGDPGTGSVLLPISDDLVPPKSIINSAQLERELVHMFSNAIMYNLNPSRGPGPAFMKGGTAADGADVVGYEVDEDAVVRSTRMMSMEVEKIIGELRNAEKERTGQAPSNSGNTRPASVATGEDTPMAEDDVDELAGDADMGSTTRRRRVGTRN
ncbi:WD domain-containing protein [Colletotrichum tofieldiae]|uniref:WD domain-containing protein n=1 Tax=Colletotrichum tofieldiae TaxID=708197 RepID=A0A166TSM4_9PEZI|nr:WD domain-containing protein [Colletotrichum tofieldiae]GKT56740.1 WD domain-containing protein [Colletotrichum tofieldiae]